MDSLDLPLVMLAFLQADCTTNSEYAQELLHIGQEINKRDSDCNAPRKMETTSRAGPRHQYSARSAARSTPKEQSRSSASPDPHDAAILTVAEGLRDIAAQLEHRVMVQAAENLNRRLEDARPEEWGVLLSDTVDWAMKHSASLSDLPQERVTLAVTLALVRGVCLKAPRLLQSLFHTALQWQRTR